MAETAQDTQQQADATQVQPVELNDAQQDASIGQGTSLDILLDVDVPVSVMIGQTSISIQRLLQLGPGAVVALEKTIDEPVDLYLKDTKFATGQVVVVEEKFAVRIKEILGSENNAQANQE